MQTVQIPDGNKFDLNFESSRIPKSLVEAAKALTDLAHVGHSDEWSTCSESCHLKEQKRAIELCRRALCEVEAIWRFSVYKQVNECQMELEQAQALLTESLG